MTTLNAHIVDDPGSSNQHTVDLYIDNPSDIGGGGGDPYVLPAATTSVLGGVKMAAHVASAAGENVTAAEFEALLDALEAAGIVSPS